MKIGNKNVKVLKKVTSDITGVKVELTSKMTVSGKIIKAVVATNPYGKHIILKTFDNLKDALEQYKKACVALVYNPGLYVVMN